MPASPFSKNSITFQKLNSIFGLWAPSLRPSSVPVLPSFGLRAETDPVIDYQVFFNIDNGPTKNEVILSFS
jgi:hypothetical protein